METPKKLEEDVKRFDFTRNELEYILNNANFNERQQKVFERLTDRKGRQTIYQIAMEMNISDRTVNREIKKIKHKIYKII